MLRTEWIDGVVKDDSGMQTASIAPPEALSLQNAFAVAGAAMKSGPLAKLDTQLTALYYANSDQATVMSAFIDSVGQLPNALSKDKAYVTVDVTITPGAAAAGVMQELQSLGMKNASAYAGLVSGQIPVTALGSIGELDGVSVARESGFFTNAGLVTTQADQGERADAARSTYGVTGAGVRVGVLSDSFAVTTQNQFNSSAPFTTYAQDVANGDLPSGMRILQDYAGGEDEGRAMAQLIHDLAPGAGIDFASADYGQAGFANNIIRLAQQGDKVIVDDVAYFAELMYQNGPIAQAVNQVSNENGVIYFSSAGNSKQEGWQGAWTAGGAYTPSTGGSYTLMNFGPATTGATGNDYLTITNGSAAYVVLQWDSPGASAGGAGSTNDLDLFISSDAAGANLTQVSLTQNVNGDPVEVVYLTSNATRYIRVGYNAAVGGAPPTNVRIVALGNGSAVNLQNTLNNTNEGTLYGHNSAENATAVAAAPFNRVPGVDPTNYPVPIVEGFSAAGIDTIYFDDNGNRYPTPQVRSIGITGVDGGNTTFFTTDSTADADTFPNFYGTSAAAPDVAAVAALILQANPNLSRADLLTLINDSALDMDDPLTTQVDVGYDTRTGYGLVQADAAVRAALTGVIQNATQTTLYGTSLNDTINGGGSADVLYGNGGNDVINAGAGADKVFGGTGNDVLYGNQDNDQLFGDAGNDVLYGGQGDDALVGGTGDDFIDGGLGNDLINGGLGTDTVSYLTAQGSVTVNLANFQATGAAGTDSLINIENIVGSAYNDILIGDANPNVIEGGPGDDTLIGGGGGDTVSYARAPSAVTVSLQNTGAQNTGGAGTDTIGGFTTLLGSAYNDTLTAADGTTVSGGAGDDHLYAPQPIAGTVDKPDVTKPAGTTNNSIANALDLTGNYDTVANPNITDSQLVPHTTVNATVGSTAELEYYKVVMTGPGRIVIDIDSYGNSTDSVIQLQDAAGNVLAYNDDGPGDPGDGGAYPGNNSYIDTVVTAAGSYYVVIGGYGSSSITPIASPAGTTYTVHISAQGQATTPSGTFVAGGSGTLLGGDGNDLLESGAGNDIIDGGMGIDTLSYAGATAGVTVSLLTTTAQATGGAGTDTITNVENINGSAYADTLTGDNNANMVMGGAGTDTIMGGLGNDVLYGNQDNDVLYGNQDNDVLYGGQGDDILFGGQGNDVLVGGLGADQLQGNLGADTFLYTQAADSTLASFDTITGFETGIDHIDLRQVIAGGAYSYQISSTGGNTTLTVDLGNNGSVDMKILLTGTNVLAASDIYFT